MQTAVGLHGSGGRPGLLDPACDGGGQGVTGLPGNVARHGHHETDAVSQLTEDDELARGGEYFHRRHIAFACPWYDLLLTYLP